MPDIPVNDPNGVRDYLRSINVRTGRAAEMALRIALAQGTWVSQSPLGALRFGPGALNNYWKNDLPRTVSVQVEVVGAGPLGAFVKVGFSVIPADTIGGKSDFVVMGMNDSLTISLSDPGIQAVLNIADPGRP